MGEGVGGSSSSSSCSKMGKVARRMVMAACAPLSCTTKQQQSPISNHISGSPTKTNSSVHSSNLVDQQQQFKEDESTTISFRNNSNVPSKRNLCAICLEALSSGNGDKSPGKAIFTAQCSHSFHFACISSNVRHGNITCPICRAYWTQLPRNLNPPNSRNQSDPVFRILDDSIANFRVHRRSFLRSARYDDDDPVEPNFSIDHSRISFSLTPVPCQPYSTSTSLFPYGPSSYPRTTSTNMRAACLTVKLTEPQAIDLVLVASSNGPHLRLLKQSMALAVFSLRSVDRLAIVTYSSSAARIFPLRRMTSYGKRTALQVIDRLFYTGLADPTEGFKKAIKILEDRAHKNPQSCILHLADCPTRSYHIVNMLQAHIPIHEFHVGFGFGSSNGYVMHEFEEFLARHLGGVIRDVQLRISEEGRITWLGEIRSGEERKILLELGECVHLCIGYSYVEGVEVDERNMTGETIVSLIDECEARDSDNESGAGREAGVSSGRSSSVEGWDYHDPYMARRWAKHLHGYRL